MVSVLIRNNPKRLSSFSVDNNTFIIPVLAAL